MSADETEFTGERFLPGLGGAMRAEHLHRYALASALIEQGSDVLDIACGEGYGSALIARRAQRVYGVDIDGPTVECARKTYADNPHVEFRVGSCDAIPLLDDSVDTVVSFETIEHHDRHEKMMREIKRVLRPGGLLILSSPNKRVYTDEPDYHNPFHVKELYRDELEKLLGEHFTGVRLFGQWSGIGSFLYSVESSASETRPALAPFIEETPGVIGQRTDDRAAVYYLALCSDNAARLARASAFSGATFCAPFDTTFTTMSRDLMWGGAEIGRLRDYQQELQTNAARMQTDLDGQQALIEEQNTGLQARANELDAARRENERLAEELRSTRHALETIQNHPAYRMAVRVKRMATGRGSG